MTRLGGRIVIANANSTLRDVLRVTGTSTYVPVLEDGGDAASRAPSMPRVVPRGRLGDLLVERGLVDEKDVARAVEAQARTGRRLGDLLLEAGALTEQALKTIDLRNHSATHPRCGAVDHISCHAVGDAPDELATQLAKGLGKGIGDRLKVPVLLYGLAAALGKSASGSGSGSLAAPMPGRVVKILIREGETHQTRNIGTETADLMLAYSSGSRVYET